MLNAYRHSAPAFSNPQRSINEPQRRRIASLTAWLCVTLVFAVIGAGDAQAQTLVPGFSQTVVPGPTNGEWNEAVGITFETNGRMWVWERGGRVWIKDTSDTTPALLLNISEEVGAWSDHGLLGFALDPHFRENGYIYLMYVVDRYHLLNYGTPGYNPATNQYFNATIGRVTRYTVNSTDGFRSIDPSSRLVLLGASKTTGIPILSETHGVGSLVFAMDGTLLISTGDGASATTADTGLASSGSYYVQALADGIIRPDEHVGAFRSQQINSLSGKILRIDPQTGNGVSSNPFFDAANPGATRSKVWALGLRNPFRITINPLFGALDPQVGDVGVLYIGDVGWENIEELDIADRPGLNFGWPRFEGLSAQPVGQPGYEDFVANPNAPNPLYPAAGCRQYFGFGELLKEATQVASAQPPFVNPCNASQRIPASIPQFLHTRPVLDWSHTSATTRTPIWGAAGDAQTVRIGTAGSPVSGAQFSGNTSAAGVFYTGTAFPSQYRGSYFHYDWGTGWIKNIKFDASNNPVSVADFLSGGGFGSVVHVAQHPIDGSLYYISWPNTIRKVTYSGNRTPVAAAAADKYYGPGPLTIAFTSAGSSDPDGQAITFSWNFGDGSPTSNQANPAHVFPNQGGPTGFVVTLTVSDSGGLSAQTTLNVAVNSTPPDVEITSPVDGTLFPPNAGGTYSLVANVSDLESTDSALAYKWQTILHHNLHEHASPIDTNHSTVTILDATGCSPTDTFYYRIVLTVTDPQGLATQKEVRLYPNCDAGLPPVAAASATPMSGLVPMAVSFSSAGSSDPESAPLTYSWTFGDGATSTEANPGHTYTQPGQYTARLSVSDGVYTSQSPVLSITVDSTAPTVSSIAPASGPIGGGTVLTITGTNFVAGATVTIGGTAATGIVVNSATAITATTPAHAAGAVNVTVTNPDAQSGTRANGFTYISTAPTLTSVSPATGLIGGGTGVTLTGTNFVAGAAVSFGGTPATGVAVTSATTITATTPAHAAGTVAVTVTNPDTQSATLAAGFVYGTTTTVPISFIQVASATPQSSPTAVTLAYPSVQTAGDLNVVVVGINNATTTVQAVQDTAGNLYTRAIGPTVGGGMQQSIYYAPNIAGGANTVTVTFSGPAPFPDIRILQYRGVSAVDGTAGATGSGTSSNSGTATTTATNALLFGANMVSSWTTAAGSGFTARLITPIDSDIAEDRIITAPGSYAATAAMASGAWVMQMVIFTPVSGPAPTVTGLTPASGSTVGGTAVTITGSNFVPGATVTIGGVAATGVVVTSATAISAITPVHAAGAVPVTVTNPDAQSGTLASGFTYVSTAPTITSVTPPSGSTLGGTVLTITGTNFVAGATVTVGGTAATNVSVTSATTITATTAAHASGAVAVAVTNPDLQSGALGNAYTYVSTAPTVTGIAPASGPATGGTAITISGTNFVAGATVTIGGTPATGVSVTSATTITATTPAHAGGSVAVTVTNPDTQAGTLASGFTYVSTAPTITSVSPASGATDGGTAITITGTNFVAGATVTVGGTAATGVTVVSATSMTAITPAHAGGLVAVTVTNPDTQSGTRANAFTYLLPVPTIVSVAPGSGTTLGGTAVTITGTNFAAGATVTIGGTAATGVVVTSATAITATTPPHAAGAVAVVVTNPDAQSATLAGAFTYISTAPTVVSVAPTTGSTLGGTVLTITGTNFVAGAAVTIGGTAATGIAVTSATSITATAPPHAAGAVPVVVTNPDTQTGTLASGFTYISTAPTVATVTPTTGTTLGGTVITITGTNFVAGATVTIGGTAATGIVVNSATSITATTPAHAAGAVSVTVTNPDAQSGTRANGFTYVSTAPTLTSVSPATGLIGGGTGVTLTGTNFVAGATVSFGGTPASGVVVTSATTITATTPAHAAGTVAVTVTNPDTQSATLGNGFVYGTTTGVPISFIQVASATPQSSPTAVTLAYPSVQTAGDLNVVVVGINNTTASVQAVQDTAGNVYTRAIGPTVAGGMQQSIYYAPAIAGGANTVTVTFTGPAAFPDIRILQYRGVSAVDVTAGATGSGTSSNSGTATTSSSNALVFGASMVSSWTTAAGSGFTSRIITPIDSDIAEDRIITAPGTYSATASMASGAWVMQMVIFK